MKRQWTQAKTAAAAKVSRPTYINAEKGRDINPLQASRIVKALGSQIDDLEVVA